MLYYIKQAEYVLLYYTQSNLMECYAVLVSMPALVLHSLCCSIFSYGVACVLLLFVLVLSCMVLTCVVIPQLTTSKFSNPPLFPPPERQEKPDDDAIYTNQVVCKQPLMHTKSTPAVPEKPRRAPPKPKLPAELAADIRTSRKLQSPNTDDVVSPATPSRYTSLKSTSSRGSTPDPDIIPINAPNRDSNEYENSAADYENSENIFTSLHSSLEMQRRSPVHGRSMPITPNHEQKPTVSSRSRSETSLPLTPEKKPSIMRDRADTSRDALSTSPSIKPWAMTVASSFPQKKHDYEEINDEIGEIVLFCNKMCYFG